jgi:hypothetical protein
VFDFDQYLTIYRRPWQVVLSLAMGAHPRLGAASPLLALADAPAALRSLVKHWSNTGQTLVEHWSNTGQTPVNRWSNAGKKKSSPSPPTSAAWLSFPNTGQTLVKHRSNTGQTCLVRCSADRCAGQTLVVPVFGLNRSPFLPYGSS